METGQYWSCNGRGKLSDYSRFWYENGGWPSSFTSDQLDEIRKVKLSRILCDNSDHLETVQVVFR